MNDSSIISESPTNNALERLFELSLDMLSVVSFDGYFLLINPAFAKTLGYKPAELKNAYIFNFIHPDDIESTTAELSRLNEGHITFSFSNRYRCKAGHYRWLEWRAQPDVETKLIYAVTRDITEQKRAKEALHLTLHKNTKQLNITTQDFFREIRARQETYRALIASEQRYRALVSIVPVGVFYTDEAGNLLYINDKWRDITGIDEANVNLADWLSSALAEDKLRVLSQWHSCLHYKSDFAADFCCSYQNKILFLAIEALAQFDEQQQFTGYIGTLSDLTRIYEAEKKSEQMRRDFAHYDRLSMAGELATGIAHEINQPLTAIMQYAGGCRQRLVDYKLPEGTHEALDRICSLAAKSADIIHRLRDFLHSGEVSRASVSIRHLIEEIMPLIEFRLNKYHIKLVLDIDPAVPTIYGDKIQLQQVLINLIGNAIDSLKINLREDSCIKIVGRYRQKKNLVYLGVIDNGMGVREDIQEKIFERFISTKAKGMGIGLSITRSIIEAHGGHIYMNSVPNVRTEFNIELPVS